MQIIFPYSNDVFCQLMEISTLVIPMLVCVGNAQCHKRPVTGNGKFIPPLKVAMTWGSLMALFSNTFQPFDPV